MRIDRVSEKGTFDIVILQGGKVMKKKLVVILSLLLMAGVVSNAAGMEIGVGGFVGVNIPVVQDDASTRSLLGLKARLQLIPALGIEPFFTRLNQGDTSIEVGGKDMSRDGGSISSFGLNLILGSMSSEMGAHFHVAAGIGSYTIKREGVPNESRLGYNLGPGIEIGLRHGLSVEVSSKFHIITLEGGGSRKNIGISGGINYYFGLGTP